MTERSTLITISKTINNLIGQARDRTSKNGNEYKYARLDIPQPQKQAEPTPPVVEESKPELSDDDIPF